VDLPQVVRDAADTSAITQLILRERESRDLGRWDEVLAKHRLSPIRDVLLSGDRAICTMPAIIEISSCSRRPR
jgi:hypothetical protein